MENYHVNQYKMSIFLQLVIRFLMKRKKPSRTQKVICNNISSYQRERFTQSKIL